MKNTYYRFLNNTSFNWSKFITLLAAKVIAYFDTLTKPERVMCLVLDDSVVERARSKKVELLSLNEPFIAQIVDEGLDVIGMLKDNNQFYYYNGKKYNLKQIGKLVSSLLDLGTEFQGLSYDMTVSRTAIVYTRYILLEWLRRKKNDDKILCEIFYVCCDDIQDMELSTALKQLMTILVNGIKNRAITIPKEIKRQLVDWFVSQPSFIKALCPDFEWGV